MTAIAIAAPSERALSSALLGSFTVSVDDLIEFPHGLLGFPECRSFALLRAETDGLFWLQSVDLPTLVFLLADPFAHFSGYAVDVQPADIAELAVGDASELALFAIVTLPAGRAEQPTANLQGPVAVNVRARRAKQIISQDSNHGVRCPLVLPVD